MLSVFNPGRTFHLREQQQHKIISAKYMAFLKCLLSTKYWHLFIQRLIEYCCHISYLFAIYKYQGSYSNSKIFQVFHATENHSISNNKPSSQEHQSRYSHTQFAYWDWGDLHTVTCPWAAFMWAQALPYQIPGWVEVNVCTVVYVKTFSEQAVHCICRCLSIPGVMLGLGLSSTFMQGVCDGSIGFSSTDGIMKGS